MADDTPQEGKLSDWSFPDDEDSVDMGVIESEIGKFIGLVVTDGNKVTHRLAFDPKHMVRICRGLVHIALEVMGKIPAPNGSTPIMN